MQLQFLYNIKISISISWNKFWLFANELIIKCSNHYILLLLCIFYISALFLKIINQLEIQISTINELLLYSNEYKSRNETSGQSQIVLRTVINYIIEISHNALCAAATFGTYARSLRVRRGIRETYVPPLAKSRFAVAVKLVWVKKKKKVYIYIYISRHLSNNREVGGSVSVLVVCGRMFLHNCVRCVGKSSASTRSPGRNEKRSLNTTNSVIA